MKQATVDRPPLLELVYGTDELVSFSVEGILEGEPVDPSDDPVWAAFMTGDTSPTEVDFQGGTWNVDRTGREPVYSGQAAPASITQNVTYAMYGRVEHAGRKVVKFCGYVRWD